MLRETSLRYSINKYVLKERKPKQAQTQNFFLGEQKSNIEECEICKKNQLITPGCTSHDVVFDSPAMEFQNNAGLSKTFETKGDYILFYFYPRNKTLFAAHHREITFLYYNS